MDKIKALKSSGSYNERHKDVKMTLFNDDEFYDPSDIVQVRYEMLRGVREHELSIDEALKQYGMSRTTYYNAKEAFEEAGVVGLIPEKRGPKGSRMNPKAEECILAYLSDHPKATTSEVCRRVLSATGITVSESTMRRFIKNRREQPG
jgi:transposase